MKISAKLTLLIVCSIITFSSNAFSRDTVTLSWDQNQDADYYIVFWGNTSGNYTVNSADLDSTVLSHQVTGLDPKLDYYFAVKAYNFCGNSSDFSDEVGSTGCPEVSKPVINDLTEK